MIPIPALPWRAIGAGILAIALFAAGWAVNGWRKNAEIDRMKTAQSEERTRQALAQVKAVDDARIEEQRRITAQTENANAAIDQARQAIAAARDAGDAADRLRKRVEGLLAAARAAGNTATIRPGAGQQGGDPLDVLVDVLGRSDNAAGQLAVYADRLRIAGLKCERDYDALTLPSGMTSAVSPAQ